MKSSPKDASNIGKEFSLFYFYLFNNNYLLQNPKDSNKCFKDGIYYLIHQINTNYNLNLSNKKLNYIDFNKFVKLFNKQLFKLPYKTLFSFFRGYYINHLYLYSTNINNNNSKIYNLHNNFLYFVIYDFHDDYLKFIYYFILNNIKYYPKIKFLINTTIDKYSINELTDKIPYKLVLLHKTKYYNNIIYDFLNYLFYDIYNNNELNELEFNIYNIYQMLDINKINIKQY